MVPRSTCFDRVCSCGRALLQGWLKFHVTHRGGKHSVERLLALEEYTKTASGFRVLIVCLGTPIPMMTLTMAQELLPLREPSAGWRANYGFWIRLALLAAAIAHTAAVQARYLVDQVNLSRIERLSIGGLVGISFSLIAMWISSATVFPLPFIAITGVPLFYPLLFLSVFVITGSRLFRAMAANWSQTIRYIRYIATQVFMAAVYPCYQVLFTRAVDTDYELAAILLLPVIKMVMKYLLSITTTHMEDLMPEAVIFTADFFNALYVATCMQTTSSLTTIAIIMTLDLGSTAISLLALHRQTRDILDRVHFVIGDQSQTSLLTSVGILCQKTHIFEEQDRAGSKVRSILHYRLSDASRALVETLDKVPTTTSAITTITSKKPSYRRLFTHHWEKRATSVHPAVGIIQPTNPAVEGPVLLENESVIQSACILQDTLKTLFTAECHVLTEYLEALIPMLYGCFILVVVRLPSAEYHIEMRDVSIANASSTVHSVFILALLEIFSFLVLVVVVERNCGMKAFYQLAFVLESQRLLIQDKLTTWALVTMAFRLVHFGVDFSFHFEWIGGKHGPEMG